MTKHIMVDLETWGTAPGSDIRSIGAVVFDPLAGALGDEFYLATENRYWDDGGYCASGGWMKWPLTRDDSTVKWWSEQSPEAQGAFSDPVDLLEALDRFSTWWRTHEEGGDYVRFWAHGPHFDEQILAACYRATGSTVPWSYRAPRDLRTFLESAGLDPKKDIPNFGTAHNALDDAKAQALGVIAAQRLLLMSRDERIVGLLNANNDQVEKRRAAGKLLREAAALFRTYEGHHRAKISEAGRPEKAERNAEIAARIETFLQEIHQ